MPLKQGSSRETISRNIGELHGGKTYAHTRRKFGKKRANKQAVAIALSQARKAKKHESLDEIPLSAVAEADKLIADPKFGPQVLPGIDDPEVETDPDVVPDTDEPEEDSPWRRTIEPGEEPGPKACWVGSGS